MKRVRLFKKKIRRASPKHKKILRNKVIRAKVILKGKKYVRTQKKRLTKYRKLYKKKPTAVLKKKIFICGRRWR